MRTAAARRRRDARCAMRDARCARARRRRASDEMRGAMRAASARFSFVRIRQDAAAGFRHRIGMNSA
ncbi:hypothetical protein AQ809_25610 [Burkholderia pseudomallei]|nr:hypothetical protein BFR05_26995 [Burkholderia pseudomallei]APG01484.1 hypothetical protein BFR06_27015 [Burkholderia pseudomallei]OMW45200.1 hypothetical protein AQ809_25610 [Burkholderia pseudomallei]OMZ34525.1 hypothetical protein AQ861_13505 [Burkholderia pseudomallei]ONA09115.1 hypothetical protein AQ876_09880 [Burkholderia pseudomallei]